MLSEKQQEGEKGEVNRKLKKEITFPGEVMPSDQGVEKLLERNQMQRDLPQ